MPGTPNSPTILALSGFERPRLFATPLMVLSLFHFRILGNHGIAKTIRGIAKITGSVIPPEAKKECKNLSFFASSRDAFSVISETPIKTLRLLF